jgi:CRP/FNR family transcriptional regulator, cyclic AMP receptor protein
MIRLLTVEPDLGRFLTPEQRDETDGLPVPVHVAGRGDLELDALLGGARAFGAIILDGMLVHHIQVGEQVALGLLGPGDMLSRSGAPPSILVDSRCSVAAPTRLALLGNEVLVAARRWPLLVAGLQLRMAEQGERLGTQLAICQMPRVDQRLLALMWLLAESWGNVTPLGTRVPLALTHDALGGLIGARRPTVTLALGELSERGAIVRQDDGWLLLERPPEPGVQPHSPAQPVLMGNSTPGWEKRTSDAGEADPHVREELRETVRRLREQHAYNVERFRERITAVAQVREQAVSSRHTIKRERLSRPEAPS